MPAVNHPNIVVCLFDSLSGLDFERQLNSLPTLAGLVNKGTYFNRCYTPNPQSSPARASLVTGLDPAVHGLWTNGVELPKSEQPFIEHTSNAGYNAYLSGRIQLAGVSRWSTESVRPGQFTQLHWAHGPLHRSRQNGYLLWLQETAPEQFAEIFPTQADPAKTVGEAQQRTALASLPDELGFNHWVAKQLCAEIKNTPQDTPFLALAGFCVGDGLGAQPESDNAGDGEELNKRALQQADDGLSALLKQLRASQVADDTVLIVVSARGNANPTDHDAAMLERSIRVPLLIYQPGQDHHRVNSLVSTMDVAPTVLAMVGVNPVSRVQGNSLANTLQGKKASNDWSLSRLRHCSSAHERNWQTAYCTGSMKLVVRHSEANTTVVSGLYNLDDDPGEQQNLVDLPEHASDLENLIDEMIDARCAMEDRTEPRTAEF